MKRYLYIIVFGLMAFKTLNAQKALDDKLAMQFYEQKQYDKAAIYFEKLYDKQPDAYFT